MCHWILHTAFCRWNYDFLLWDGLHREQTLALVGLSSSEASIEVSRNKKETWMQFSNGEKDELTWELLPLMLPLFRPCIIISASHHNLLTAVNAAISILTEGTSTLKRIHPNLFPSLSLRSAAVVLQPVFTLNFYLSITAGLFFHEAIRVYLF